MVYRLSINEPSRGERPGPTEHERSPTLGQIGTARLKGTSSRNSRDPSSRIRAVVGPAKVGDKISRIDFKSFCKAKKTRQAEVPLATLYGRDESEVQADSLRECHLTQPKLRTPMANSLAKQCLCRVPPWCPSHQRTFEKHRVYGARVPDASRDGLACSDAGQTRGLPRWT